MSAKERARWIVTTAGVLAIPLFYLIFFHLTADDMASYESGGLNTAIHFTSYGRYLAAALVVLNNVLFGGNVAIAFVYKIGILFAVSGIVFTLPIPNIPQDNRASLIFRACGTITIVTNPRFLDLFAFSTNSATTFAILTLLLLFVVLTVGGRLWLAGLTVFIGLFFYQQIVVAAAMLGFYILICNHLEQKTPLTVMMRRVLFLAAALATVTVVHTIIIVTLTERLMSFIGIKYPTFPSREPGGTSVLGSLLTLARIGISDFFASDWYGMTVGKRLTDGDGFIERPELRLFTALTLLTIVAMGFRSRRWVAVGATFVLFVLSWNLLGLASPSNLISMRASSYAGFFPVLASALFLGVLSDWQYRVAVRLWIALAIVLSLNCAHLSYDTYRLQEFEYSLAARIISRLEMTPGFVPGTSRVSIDYRYSKPESASLRMISMSGLHGKLRATWAQRQFLEHVAGYPIAPLVGGPGGRCGSDQTGPEGEGGMNARVINVGTGDFLVCVGPVTERDGQAKTTGLGLTLSKPEGAPFTFNQTVPLEELSAIHDATLTSGDDRVRILATGDDPQLLLPALNLRKDSSFALGVEIEAPADTEAQVFYQTLESDRFSGECQVNAPLKKGPNKVWFQIPRTGLNGRFRFDPGSTTGEYVLHAMIGSSSK